MIHRHVISAVAGHAQQGVAIADRTELFAARAGFAPNARALADDRQVIRIGCRYSAESIHTLIAVAPAGIVGKLNGAEAAAVMPNPAIRECRRARASSLPQAASQNLFLHPDSTLFPRYDALFPIPVYLTNEGEFFFPIFKKSGLEWVEWAEPSLTSALMSAKHAISAHAWAIFLRSFIH